MTRAPAKRGPRVLRLIEAAGLVVVISGAGWLAWAAALGDRTTAMVVALSATCAIFAVFMSRLGQGTSATVLATAAFGATPAIALATLRALSEPLMGTAFSDGAARQREGIEAVIIAAALAAVCAAAAAVIANRRLERRRLSRVLVAFMTWSPLLVAPASLIFTLADGYQSPAPDDYSMSQPVLAHMEPARTDGVLVVDELDRVEGVTLVRVCEDTPWCYTLLRRGDRVTTRPGQVPREAPVHLRYDRAHELFLVESAGLLVSTVNASDLASYNRLLPHHVRKSLTPPRAYSVLAVASLVAALLIWLQRRRLRRRRQRAEAAQAGVCFGDGWGLLADGTAMRVPMQTKRGSFVVLWSQGREATLTLIEGTRDEIAARFDQRRTALDALQLATMWTLCTPLLIAAAVV